MTDSNAELDLDAAGLGDLIERLVRVARSHGLSAMSVNYGALSVELSINSASIALETAARPFVEQSRPLAPTPSADVSDFITAPMVGTFYVGSKPGEPPFVAAGDRLEVGQTIGVIEAMKIMNEIPCEVACLVLEALVTNGQPVEYGTPLFRIAPGSEA